MAATSNRQSFLTLDPIKFSLTDGTNIPPPEDTPPTTSNGPKAAAAASTAADTKSTQQNGDGDPQTQTQSERKPGPPSVLSNSTSPQHRHGVRRLFSLGSLRSSFSGSRASLSLPPQDSAHRNDATDSAKPPASPSLSHHATGTSPKTGKLRKSDNWFKRKSGMLFSNGDKPLASIGEDGRPESKRAREHSPAPLLPDIKSLAGGDLKDGEVEWDDRQFKRPA